jgi:hypothetical protein
VSPAGIGGVCGQGKPSCVQGGNWPCQWTLALAAQQTYETMKASGYSWDKAREVAEAELLARPELRPEGDGPSEELQEEAREKEREYLRNPPVM